MIINYSGLRDPHLNVFYSYGDKSHLENNITKAFVNILQSLNNEELKKAIKFLFSIDLPDGEYTSTFFLQKKPKEDYVKKYDLKLMFAFSPTGKSWGFEGLDTKDEKEIRRVLEEEAKKRSVIEAEQNEYVEYNLNEILKTRREGGSIPDGWQFIDIDGKPFAAIAMENKLYDLDPYQLNNHIEKSLFITDLKSKPIYKKYSDIIELFKNLNTYLSNQFVEYLTILNYTKVDDFSIACRADKYIRSELVKNFAEDILNIVHDGNKDFRKGQIARCYVNYDYLHEINLSFEKETIELRLSFGATQNGAKEMLSRIDNINIDDPRYIFFIGFHLLYYRGRILNELYVNNVNNVNNWELNEYIDYWKRNIDLVKTSTPEEAIKLYKKLFDDGKIDQELLDKAIQRLTGKKNLILVVPQISFEFRWSYEEADKLGLESFAKDIKSKFEIAMKTMKLNLKK